MDEFADVLNAEQLAAVTAPDGPLLVLAAAGTGKTRTLVYRVAWLVREGIASDRILLLTFTNKAASEMLVRAETHIGARVGGIWGGTFHHMANRILRRHARLLDYPSDYTILDRDDSRKLVQDCLKTLSLTQKEFPKAAVLLSVFGRAANTQISIEDTVKKHFGDCDADTLLGILTVHKRYEKRKRELDAMDFDDLLINGLALFQEHPEVLAVYQDRFEHVLVDEYQDTNPIQAQWVDLVAAKRRNLLVVGDDFQSIYSWRGADFRNILSFPERYPGARVLKLETNYRSVPEILGVANACIACNPHQFQKVMRATRESCRKPAVVWLRDGEQQARYVVQEVARLRSEGYRMSEMAVLYRAHFHAMELQSQLARERIPYVITSGVRFFEQAHIKDVCCLLRLVHHPRDELAFRRLVELLPGVGQVTSGKLWKRLGARFDVRDADSCAEFGGMLRGAGQEVWEILEAGLRPVLDETDTSPEAGGRLVDEFVRFFYRRYAVDTYENYDVRMDDINELIAFAGRFASMDAFLADVALLTNLDAEVDERVKEGQDCLRLSTVHQAKGLEWSVVFALWLTDGMFPSSRSLSDTLDGEAEERRLFYVTTTRAKDELYFCVPEVRRTRDRKVIPCKPSRFVVELPRRLLREEQAGFV